MKKRRNKRKPVVRMFLKEYYAGISGLLAIPALAIYAIVVADLDCSTSMYINPQYIPALIVATIMLLIAIGLCWIYDESFNH